MFTTLFIPVLLIQPSLVSQQTVESAELQTKLQASLEDYRLSGDTFLQGLTKVAAQFEIPMGIEWVKSPETLKNVELTLQRVTVSQIIESLVKSQPGYEFQIKGSNVHIFPKDLRTDKRNFLNLRIHKFEVQDEFVGFAERKLQALVKRTINPPPPAPPGAGEAGSIATGMGDRRVSFKLENVTVRDVLDQLSLAADFKVWVVTYSDTPILTRMGFFRVLRPYGNSNDADDPTWALLLWGTDPVSMRHRPDWKGRTSAP